MTRWNPNSYYKEGKNKGYSSNYLNSLVVHGKKIAANNIPVIYSLKHLALLSGTNYNELYQIVSRLDIDPEGPSPNYPYKIFPIRKRRGGKRLIAIPYPTLMAVQRWVSQEILNKLPVHPAAFAYVAGKKNPLRDHAKLHCDADWILKLDIKNFFSNISERQIYKVFKTCNYYSLLSFEMARLCTMIVPSRRKRRWNNSKQFKNKNLYPCDHIGFLPQGAPTSPALSNLTCIDMDNELTKLALENGANYSRYADDLCFSFTISTRRDLLKFKRTACELLWKNGFSENKTKTKILPPGSKKVITGLIINSGKPMIPKELRDRVRMHLYFSKKLGIPEHCKRRGFRSIIGFRNHLYGLILYIKSIDPKKGEVFRAAFKDLPWVNFNI
ncbi:reverse transcriptase family protein [Desulfotignum balticum]|uniref:reverse transcriptase family protein n=1 Tax=Desulfotignum balticum TaxID=115781 RepID=UPI00040F95FE|nr:reverse transcriptase family protein [Desulfotignum balticum]